MSDNIFELTPEEEFKFRFERYFPELHEHLTKDTLGKDEEFDRKTAEMAALARKAGIDISEYTIQYFKDHGITE